MTLSEKKALIGNFIGRCNRYADEKLARYRDELQHATGPAALAIQDKIGHWTAYRTFNEYTLGELEGETLDHWLE